MHSQRTTCRKGRGGGGDLEAKEGETPEQRALPAHGMQEWGEVGVTPHQEGEGGEPPKQKRTPSVRGLIQEMGGGPQDLQRLPTARRSGSERARGERTIGRRRKEGAPIPLGGRGTSEVQAIAIVHCIVNSPLGRSTPSVRPAPPKGPGDGGAGTGSASEEGEAGGGAWGDGAVGPHPEEGRL